VRTARLELRQWREDDLALFAALNADPETMRFFPSALTREQSDSLAERARAQIAERGWGLWAVEVFDSDRFIGFVGLAEPRFEAHFTPAVEVGWRLARDAWGRGYATEGGRAALAFAFDELGLDEVVSFTAVVNERGDGETRDEPRPRRRLRPSVDRRRAASPARALSHLFAARVLSDGRLKGSYSGLVGAGGSSS